MFKRQIVVPTLLMLAGGVMTALGQQGRQDPATLISAQREAMKRLAVMDGVGDRIMPPQEPVRFFEMNLK